MYSWKAVAVLVGLPLVVGCDIAGPVPETNETAVDHQPNLNDIRVPDGFNFSTTRDVEVNLDLSDVGPVDGAVLKIGFEKDGELAYMVTSYLDASATYTGLLPIANWVDRLIIDLESKGQVHRLALPIESRMVTYPGAVLANSVRVGSLDVPEVPEDVLQANPSHGPSLIPEDLSHYPIRTITHYPSENDWGTIAFEDLWPAMGDYDFNDLVASYHVTQYRSQDESTVAMEFLLRVDWVGAGYQNALAVALPIDRQRVIKVEGSVSARLDETGLEPGIDQMVTFLFDDPGQLGGQPTRIVVHFRTPLKDWELGTPPFDPFLVVDGDRGREVHLIGKPPTAKANQSMLGSEDDNGNYATTSGLPWAILLPEAWDWPVEKASIQLGYLEFVGWAESGGAILKDWYRPKANNRNLKYLMSH